MFVQCSFSIFTYRLWAQVAEYTPRKHNRTIRNELRGEQIYGADLIYRYHKKSSIATMVSASYISENRLFVRFR